MKTPGNPECKFTSTNSRDCRFEQCCGEFLTAYKRGDRPQIEEWLSRAAECDQTALLERLILIELEMLRDEGGSPEARPYIARFPNRAEAVAAAFTRYAKNDGARRLEETIVAGGEVLSDGAPSSPASLLPPAIGGYHILSELGRGGGGRVFLANDPRLDRLVAIKIMHSLELLSETSRERFLLEARSAARLDHPGIVRVYEMNQTGDQLYIVQQYVEGENLAQCVQGTPWPAKRIADCLGAVAAALAFAHKKGLVHCDLKPQNILIDRDGAPHIVDFGLVVDERTQRQRRGERSGTALYMSPEQVRGEVDRLDGRTDIWSLGVILYELSTGCLPFQGTSREEICDEILHRDPKPPRMIDETIPAALERIILKCLEKPATARYTTACELSTDLRKLGCSTARWWRAGAAVVTALAVGAVSFMHFASSPNSGRQPTPLAAAAVLVPLRVTKIDVLHIGQVDGQFRPRGLIGDESFDPKVGDQIWLAAKLSKPAYAYLIAFRPDGAMELCFPETEDVAPAATNEPRYPAVGAAVAYGLNEGTGLWVFALIASETPLPGFRDWQSSLEREGIFPRWEPVDDAESRLVWRIDTLGTLEVGSEEGLGGVERGKDEHLAGTPGIILRLIESLRAERPQTIVSAIAFCVSPKAPAPLPVVVQEEDDFEREINAIEQDIIEARNGLEYVKAVTLGKRVVDLRTRAHGAEHWKTTTARARLKTIERIASLDAAAQKEVNATYDQIDEARKKLDDERFDDCVALLEHALGVRRRRLGGESLETVGCLNNMAMVLSALGRFDDADELYRQAAEGILKALGENHPELATAYSNLALNLQESGKYLEAMDFLKQGLAIDLRSVGPDSPMTANTQNSLGVVLDALGRHSEARPHYESSLRILVEQPEPNRRDEIRVRGNLAANAKHMGDLARAESESRVVLTTSQHLFGAHSAEAATNAGNLATILDDQQKYEEAEELLRGALGDLTRVFQLNHPTTAGCLNNLAANLAGQNRLTEAEALYRTSLAINRGGLGRDHPSVAVLTSNLADVLADQGRDDEAESLLRDALRIWEAIDPDHPEAATVANNLGMLLVDLGRFTDAQPLLERALEIRQRKFSPEHPLTAQSLNNLGGLFEMQGQLSAAERWYREAQEVRLKLDAESLAVAESCNNLAVVINDPARFDESERLYRRALQIRDDRLGRGHPLTAQSLRNLGAFLLDRGDNAAAEKMLEAAADAFQNARLRVGFTGMERIKFAAAQSPLIALAIVKAKLGKTPEAWQRLEEHLGRGLLDEMALRRSLQLPREDRDVLRDRIVEVEQLDRLFDVPTEKLQTSGSSQTIDELKIRRETALRKLAEIRQRIDEVHGPISGTIASLEELQSVLPDDAAIIAWVDREPALGERGSSDGEHWGVVVRSRGAPRWTPLHGSGAERRWNANDAQLPSQVRLALTRPGGPSGVELAELLGRLRSQRLDPLAPLLDSADHGLPRVRSLVVLPSSAVAGIPVEVLLSPDDKRAVSYAPSASVFVQLRRKTRVNERGGLLAIGDPVFWHEQFDGKQVEPLPKQGLLLAAVLPGMNASRHRLKAGDVLLSYQGIQLHNPADLQIIPESQEPIEVEIWRDGRILSRQVSAGRLGVILDPQSVGPGNLARRGPDEQHSNRGGFSPLPGSGVEVSGLAKLFEVAAARVELLIGVDASEERVQRLAAADELKQFSYIHLATHGLIDDASPGRSAIVLTQVDLPDPLTEVWENRPVIDGLVSSREIERSWNLNASLVTLSACETARGRYAAGEGYVGFTQSLLSSGARSVCLSLWKVDDLATTLLMRRFYENLLRGRDEPTERFSKAEALAEAKRWLRNLTADEALSQAGEATEGIARGKAQKLDVIELKKAIELVDRHAIPFEHPRFWAAFILIGDPN